MNNKEMEYVLDMAISEEFALEHLILLAMMGEDEDD